VSSTQNQIRADYDRDTIVVYQAYRDEIADAALAAGRFVSPFSFGRMTWIKPSFLWMMERSNWGLKSGQERVLAVRITRKGWEQALAWGVLTHHEGRVYRTYEDWKKRIDSALVHIQWDPERSVRGAHLPQRAIQVGISRHVIKTFVEEWIVELKDYTPLVRKMYKLIQAGDEGSTKKLLPKERAYPVDEVLGRQIGVGL
jgi:hypothetical protein